jgi:hypothetical protein
MLPAYSSDGFVYGGTALWSSYLEDEAPKLVLGCDAITLADGRAFIVLYGGGLVRVGPDTLFRTVGEVDVPDWVECPEFVERMWIEDL